MATDEPISATLALVGGVVSAAGTIYAGQAQAKALNYQSQVAANNAITADRMAQNAREVGQKAAADLSLKEAEEGGKIVAAEAAGNVDVNTGSNRAVRTSQRELGAMDIQTEEYNKGILPAYGYTQEATNYQAQSGLYAYEAPQAEIGADIGAAGQVFGAASKFYAPSGNPYTFGQP